MSLTKAIDDLSQAHDAVHASREQLRRLSRRVVEIQEVERRYIARELHDEIGQTLTGLGLALKAKASSSDNPEGFRELQEEVTDLTQRVRELSLDLRPAMLDDLGLLPAFTWYFKRYSAQTDVAVDFKHTNLDIRFLPEVETAAYRIVQEALTNVARHAEVDQVSVQVQADQESLVLRINDQGRGFDQRSVLAAISSSGLAGMIERASLLGGQLQVNSAKGKGCEIAAKIPLSPMVAYGAEDL